ncbi:MAG: aldo/keto reductase [Pseudomonadota bacterium]
MTQDTTTLAFGTMQFGGGADAAQSEAMYRACRDAGITHFDTAYVYTDGASEKILGGLISAERDALYLATKNNFAAGNGRAAIEKGLDVSRQRLGVDSVDLYYLHRFDDDTPLEESFETLAELQSRGLLRHIGVSNFAAWQVMKAQAVAARFGTRINAIQPMLNLVKRQVTVEILPMAQSEAIDVYVYSPLGGGLLTGKYARGAAGRLATDQMYAKRYGQDWMHQAAVSLGEVADDIGTDPSTLAVAWTAATPGVTAPLISARNLEQLGPSLAAATFEMTGAIYDRLSSLTPTPPPATDRLEEA